MRTFHIKDATATLEVITPPDDPPITLDPPPTITMTFSGDAIRVFRRGRPFWRWARRFARRFARKE